VTIPDFECDYQSEKTNIEKLGVFDYPRLYINKYLILESKEEKIENRESTLLDDKIRRCLSSKIPIGG